MVDEKLFFLFNTEYPSGKDYFCQLILLFNLFLLLFMGPTTLFGIIHVFHCTILANFYLYIYFQQKVFGFCKISRSQTDPEYIKILTFK